MPDLPEPTWQNERRERVETWLRKWSKDLAELYLAAVRLLHGPSDVPAHLRLAAHAAREILNRLPHLVAPGERWRLDYKKRVDVLLAAVADLPFEGRPTSPSRLPRPPRPQPPGGARRPGRAPRGPALVRARPNLRGQTLRSHGQNRRGKPVHHRERPQGVPPLYGNSAVSLRWCAFRCT